MVLLTLGGLVSALANNYAVIMTSNEGVTSITNCRIPSAAAAALSLKPLYGYTPLPENVTWCRIRHGQSREVMSVLFYFFNWHLSILILKCLNLLQQEKKLLVNSVGP